MFSDLSVILLLVILVLLLVGFSVWYCVIKSDSSKGMIIILDTIILLLSVVGILLSVYAREEYRESKVTEIDNESTAHHYEDIIENSDSSIDLQENRASDNFEKDIKSKDSGGITEYTKEFEKKKDEQEVYETDNGMKNKMLIEGKALDDD